VSEYESGDGELRSSDKSSSGSRASSSTLVLSRSTTGVFTRLSFPKGHRQIFAAGLQEY